MSDEIGRWTAIIGMAVMAGIFVLDVRRWRMPGSVVGRRQQVLRCVLICLIEAILVLWFLGPTVANGCNLILILVYWALCLFLMLAVVIFAFLDLRESSRELIRQRMRISQELMEDRKREP